MPKNFGKNLAKSFKYGVIDTFLQNTAPDIAETLKSNKEDMQSLLDSGAVKGLTKKDVETMLKKQSTEIKKGFTDVRKNLISDMKSGKWFGNQERSSKSIQDSMFGDMGDMFGDDDFMNGFDFEEGEITISKNEKSGNMDFNFETRNETNVNDNRTNVNNITQIQNKVDGKLLASVTGQMVNSMATISTQIKQISQFHLDETRKYYNDSLTLLSDINNTLKDVYTLQTPVGQKSILDSIFIGNTINLKEYGKALSSSFLGGMLDKDNLEMLKMMGQSMIADPMKTILDIGMDFVIPESIKKSMSELNDTFVNTTKSMIMQLAEGKQGKGGPLQKVLGSLFGLDLSTSSAKAKFENKAIAYDAESKRAITQTIPTYLAKLLNVTNAIATRIKANVNDNNELHLDTRTGTLKKASTIRRQNQQIREKENMSSMSGFFELLEKQEGFQYKVGPEQLAKIKKYETENKRLEELKKKQGKFGLKNLSDEESKEYAKLTTSVATKQREELGKEVQKIKSNSTHRKDYAKAMEVLQKSGVFTGRSLSPKEYAEYKANGGDTEVLNQLYADLQRNPALLHAFNASSMNMINARTKYANSQYSYDSMNILGDTNKTEDEINYEKLAKSKTITGTVGKTLNIDRHSNQGEYDKLKKFSEFNSQGGFKGTIKAILPFLEHTMNVGINKLNSGLSNLFFGNEKGIKTNFIDSMLNKISNSKFLEKFGLGRWIKGKAKSLADKREEEKITREKNIDENLSNLAEHALKRGSIYSHDIHLEGILKSIAIKLGVDPTEVDKASETGIFKAKKDDSKTKEEKTLISLIKENIKDKIDQGKSRLKSKIIGDKDYDANDPIMKLLGLRIKDGIKETFEKSKTKKGGIVHTISNDFIGYLKENKFVEKWQEIGMTMIDEVRHMVRSAIKLTANLVKRYYKAIFGFAKGIFGKLFGNTKIGEKTKSFAREMGERFMGVTNFFDKRKQEVQELQFKRIGGTFKEDGSMDFESLNDDQIAQMKSQYKGLYKTARKQGASFISEDTKATTSAMSAVKEEVVGIRDDITKDIIPAISDTATSIINGFRDIFNGKKITKKAKVSKVGKKKSSIDSVKSASSEDQIEEIKQEKEEQQEVSTLDAIKDSTEKTAEQGEKSEKLKSSRFKKILSYVTMGMLLLQGGTKTVTTILKGVLGAVKIVMKAVKFGVKVLTVPMKILGKILQAPVIGKLITSGLLFTTLYAYLASKIRKGVASAKAGFNLIRNGKATLLGGKIYNDDGSIKTDANGNPVTKTGLLADIGDKIDAREAKRKAKVMEEAEIFARLRHPRSAKKNGKAYLKAVQDYMDANYKEGVLSKIKNSLNEGTKDLFNKIGNKIDKDEAKRKAKVMEEAKLYAFSIHGNDADPKSKDFLNTVDSYMQANYKPGLLSFVKYKVTKFKEKVKDKFKELFIGKDKELLVQEAVKAAEAKGLKQGTPEFDQAVHNFIEANGGGLVQQGLNKVKSKVKSFANKAFNKVKDLFATKSTQELIQEAVKAAESRDDLVPGTPEYDQFIHNYVKNNSGVRGSLKNAFNKVKSGVKNGIKKIGNALGITEKIEAMKLAMATKTEAMKQKMEIAATSEQNFFQMAQTKIREALKLSKTTATEGTKATMEIAATGEQTVFQMAQTKLREGAKWVWDTIKEPIKAGIEIVGSGIKALATAANGAFPGAGIAIAAAGAVGLTALIASAIKKAKAGKKDKGNDDDSGFLGKLKKNFKNRKAEKEQKKEQKKEDRKQKIKERIEAVISSKRFKWFGPAKKAYWNWMAKKYGVTVKDNESENNTNTNSIVRGGMRDTLQFDNNSDNKKSSFANITKAVAKVGLGMAIPGLGAAMLATDIAKNVVSKAKYQIGQEKDGLIWNGGKWIARASLSIGQRIGNMVWNGEKLVSTLKETENQEKELWWQNVMTTGLLGEPFDFKKVKIGGLWSKLKNFIGSVFGGNKNNNTNTQGSTTNTSQPASDGSTMNYNTNDTTHQKVAGVGSVSEKYETSNRGGGTVGKLKGDAGGTSYGVSQFSTNAGSADEFANWFRKTYPQMAAGFSTYKAGTPEFDNAWVSTYNAYGEAFTAAQREYTYNKIVVPFIKKAKDKYGVDLSSTKALQELAYSTAVQFGPRGTYALGDINSNMTEEEIIKTSFAAKRDNAHDWFSGSSTAVQESLKNNRFVTEEQDILALLNQPAVENNSVASATTTELKGNGVNATANAKLTGGVIPAGAAIYAESPSEQYKIYGHVGISDGKGGIYHNIGKLAHETLTDFSKKYKVLGWGWHGGVEPTEQQKSAIVAAAASAPSVVNGVEIPTSVGMCQQFVNRAYKAATGKSYSAASALDAYGKWGVNNNFPTGVTMSVNAKAGTKSGTLASVTPAIASSLPAGSSANDPDADQINNSTATSTGYSNTMNNVGNAATQAAYNTTNTVANANNTSSNNTNYSEILNKINNTLETIAGYSEQTASGINGALQNVNAQTNNQMNTTNVANNTTNGSPVNNFFAPTNNYLNKRNTNIQSTYKKFLKPSTIEIAMGI